MELEIYELVVGVRGLESVVGGEWRGGYERDAGTWRGVCVGFGDGTGGMHACHGDGQYGE